MKLTCVTAVFNAIAAGNRERLIRCVESVAKIPVEHEHLIYDGASTDGTVELLRELEKTTPGLKVVSEPDTGIYNALNKGVRDAKGEWFYVLGCDDRIFSPDELVRTLENCGLSDVLASTVIFTNGVVWRPTRKIVMAALPCSHQALLVRTAAVRELGGFSTDFRLVSDFDMIQRLALRGYSIKEFTTAYAIYGAEGASANKKLLRAENEMLLKSRFNLTEKEAEVLWPERVLPWHAFSPYLLSRHQWIRNAAWYQLLRLIAFWLGLIRIGRGVVHA